MFSLFLTLGIVVMFGGVIALALYLAKRGQKDKDDAEALAKVLDDVSKANKAAADINKLSDDAVIKLVFDKWSK